MRSSLSATLTHILRYEGGWVDDPHDPGGCTMRGITLATYRAHGHPRATCTDLHRSTEYEARAIYAGTYWADARGDMLPPGVDLLVVDHGVNAGIVRAIYLLQGVALVAQDGEIGPITRAAVDRLYAADPARLIRRIADARRTYYRGRGPELFGRYGRGWLARVDAAQMAALRLAQDDLYRRAAEAAG